MNASILMEEEYWRNSHLSIARFYGGINLKLEGKSYEYIIVDEFGRDLFQCSAEAEKEGRDMAIEPGEPCDLLCKGFLHFYKKLGRDAFIEVLKKNQYTDDKELMKIYKKLTKKE